MKQVLLVGAFHEMIELCEDSGFEIVGLIDNAVKTSDYFGYPVLGTDEDAKMLHEKYPMCSVVITPDAPSVRKRLVRQYVSLGFEFATIVHPSAMISKTAYIGQGSVIQRGVNVSSNTCIGRFCKLNTNANVMHDNHVGDFSTIAPNAVLLGYVNLGECAYIGANSTVLPNHTIGNGSIVGAGAVVVKDVPSGRTVVGVPAKIIDK